MDSYQLRKEECTQKLQLAVCRVCQQNSQSRRYPRITHKINPEGPQSSMGIFNLFGNKKDVKKVYIATHKGIIRANNEDNYYVNGNTRLINENEKTETGEYPLLYKKQLIPQL